MKRIKYLAFYWLPTIVWMLMIFYFSSYQRISISSQYYLNFLFFKILHLLEYAFLYFLWFRSIFSLKNIFFTSSRKFYYPILITTLYAITDEIHQLSVATREGRIRDVLIDIVGVLIMYTLIRRYFDFVKKKFL